MVSIIMPCYNIAATLETSIRHILNQPYKDIEILGCDDGSSDSTYDILENLSKEDNRVRVFTLEHKGISSARNIGLSNMRGEYFTFADGDDKVYNNIYKIASQKMDEHPEVDILTFSNTVKFENGFIKECIHPEGIFKGNYVKNIISYDNLHQGAGYTWNRLIRNHGFWDRRKIFFKEGLHLFEDKLWFLELIEDDTNLMTIPDLGYEYGVFDRPANKEKLLNYMAGLKEIMDFPGLPQETDVNRRYNYAASFTEALDFAIKNNDLDMTAEINRRLSIEPQEVQQFIALCYKKLTTLQA